MEKKIKYALFCVILFSIFIFSGVVTVGEEEPIEIDEIPIGGIIIWTGHLNDFDHWGVMINNTNWHLCNGNNGTTDLSTKFLVGVDDEHSDYEYISEMGGEEKHVLTVGELPYHEHSYIDTFHRTNKRTLAFGNIVNAELVTSLESTTSGVGDNQPHENRPPYYTVAFIQKVSDTTEVFNCSNFTNPAIYVQLSDSTDQTFPLTDTGYNILFNTNDEINGILHSETIEPQNITIVTSGVYSIFAQPQVHASPGASGYFHMWLRKDTGSGFADIPNTNVELTLDTNNEDVIALIIAIHLNAGDVIRVNVSVAHTGIELDHQAVVGEPDIPSIIFTMYKIGS